MRISHIGVCVSDWKRSLRVDDLDPMLSEIAGAGVRVLRETRIEIPRARTKAVASPTRTEP